MMAPVRRSFAGLFFGLAFACACLTISGFLLQRTAFSPDASADAADVVLQDDALRAELVDVVVEATASQLQLTQPEVRTTVEYVAQHPAGAELLAGVLRDAHAKLIGESEAPVQITGPELVAIVRSQAVADLPPVELDVPRVGALAVVDDVLAWLVPIMAIAAVAFLALCFLAHPERAALVRTLGLGLLVLASLVLLFGYVIPKLVPPLLTDSVWARMPPRLADRSLPLVVGAVLVLAGGGLAMFVASSRIRRSRRWSTPVSTYRYREERSWS